MSGKVTREIQDQFYNGDRTSTCHFCINNAVEIIDGDLKGEGGAIISIEAIEPEVLYLVEIGNGSDHLVPQKFLEMYS